MSSSADALAAVKSEIEQALALMRTQMGAFRRTAAPEVMAAYPRIAIAIGREEYLVTRGRTKAGLKELVDEAELLAWDVPQLLEGLFTEAWMQECFTANDTYPETTAYRIYDYLRARGRPESPFPAHFASNLHRTFQPLSRMLRRAGFTLGRSQAHARVDASAEDGHLFPRLAELFKMNPVLTSGATLFGEQARRCHDLRQKLRPLEVKAAQEHATALWDEVEAERGNKRQ